MPRPGQQAGLGLGGRWRSLDQRNNLVDIRQRDRLPFQDVCTAARLPRLEYRAPGYDLATVSQKRFQHRFETEEFWLAIDQSDHVDAKHGLQLRVFVQVVQHYIGYFAAAQLDDDAHAVLVGLIAQFGNALNFLVAHQFGNLFQQSRLVDLVWQLGDDNGLLVVAADIFNMRPRTQVYASPACGVGLVDPARAIDHGRGRKIRARYVLDQIANFHFRIVDQGHAGRHDFPQVVRWNIGRHADGDAGRTIDQEIRNPGRHYRWFEFRLIVVGDEIDGFLVDIGKQFMGDARHSDFGVSHRGRCIAIHRAKVSLPVDQHETHRKRLRHPHQRVVNGGIAMGVIFADHIADDAGRFLIRFVVVVAQFLHRKKDPAMHRFQPIAHVGQGPSNDDAHRVVQVGLTHFVFEIYVNYSACDFGHQGI